MKGGTMPEGYLNDGKEFITTNMPTHGTMPSGVGEVEFPRPQPRPAGKLPKTGTVTRETVKKTDDELMKECFPRGQRNCAKCGKECYYSSEKVNHIRSHKYKHITIPLTRRQIGNLIFGLNLLGGLMLLLQQNDGLKLGGIFVIVLSVTFWIVGKLVSGDDLNPFHLLNREVKLKE